MPGRYGGGEEWVAGSSSANLRRAGFLMLVAVASCAAAGASAQDAETFYKTHTLTLGSPNSPGGGYDIYLRVLARHCLLYTSRCV